MFVKRIEDYEGRSQYKADVEAYYKFINYVPDKLAGCIEQAVSEWEKEKNISIRDVETLEIYYLAFKNNVNVINGNDTRLEIFKDRIEQLEIKAFATGGRSFPNF